jgi:hypothetical protein
VAKKAKPTITHRIRSGALYELVRLSMNEFYALQDKANHHMFILTMKNTTLVALSISKFIKKRRTLVE